MHIRLPESQASSLSIKQHSPPCCLQIVFQSEALFMVQVVCKFKEWTKNIDASQSATKQNPLGSYLVTLHLANLFFKETG